MATRSGTVDPGLLLWLQQRGGLSANEVSDGLEHASGLAGLTGRTADMRDVQAAADRGEQQAQTALAVYVHRLRREIAAMAAAMNGLDALVFTGGIGEHQPRLRAAAVTGLTFLGLALDPNRDQQDGGDADISHADAAAHTLVITAREDLEIAQQIRTLFA